MQGLQASSQGVQLLGVKILDLLGSVYLAKQTVLLGLQSIGLGIELAYIALKTGQPARDGLEPNLAIHRVLAGVATGSYLGAGIVAWTMPPALISGPRAADTSVKKGVDSGKLHMALSVLHGVAMGTVVATGILQANVATGEAWEALVTSHAIAGFTAAGAVITAGLVIGTL